MTIQTLTVILCSLVIICSRKIGVEATVFTTHLNPETWKSARDRCTLKNATLATTSLYRRNGLLLVNDTEFKLDSNHTLWVGYVKQFHYFMFKGCVSESTLIFTDISQHGISQCYSYCNTQYVGLRTREIYHLFYLQGWDCFCIKVTPISNTLVDCLDHNIMIYEHVQPEPFSIKTDPGPEDILMCGLIWVQANTAREIKMHSCMALPQTWCEKNSTISMGGKCNANRKIWAESIHCCTASRLPQVLPKTIKDFTFSISTRTRTSIWTALVLESIVIDHKRLHGLLHPESKCAYVMKGASGMIELRFDNCTTNRRYICSDYTYPTTEGASPTTSVVTSISTSSLSSTLSSSSKDGDWVPLVAGISGAVVGLLIIISVVVLCWKWCSKRRTKVARTDQVVHGQEGSLPLNDTVHTYEGLIGASLMTRPDPNNYDVLDVGIDDTEHTYEGVIGASVMTRPDPNNYDVLDVGIDNTEHTYEGVIGASVMIRPDSNNYVNLNAGILM